MYACYNILVVNLNSKINAKQKQPSCKKVRGQSKATNISDQKF